MFHIRALNYDIQDTQRMYFDKMCFIILFIANHQHVFFLLVIIARVSISVNFHYMGSIMVARAAEGSRHGLVRDPIMAFGWRDLRKSQKKNIKGKWPFSEPVFKPETSPIRSDNHSTTMFIFPSNSNRAFIYDKPNMFRESKHVAVLMG